MDYIHVELNMKLLSDAIFSSGNSIPGGEDIALRLDINGEPVLPGTTFKGLLRESVTNILCWTGRGGENTLSALFGEDTREEQDLSHRLIFSDFRLKEVKDPNACFGLRTFTKLSDEGVVETGTLRMAACLNRGLEFQSTLLCHRDDFDLVEMAVRAIQWVGLLRNRGFGHVCITARKGTQLLPAAAVGQGHWLRYQLLLKTPMVISDVSQNGGRGDGYNRNYTDSRCYLPGSAVRGMVLSQIAREDPAWFESNKETLLRHIHFQNALPMQEGETQIPTPMGFYESKDKSRFYSVLSTDVVAGDKRARLGKFCRVKDGKILSSTPKMETALHISLADRADKQVFTLRAMAAGTVLEGYIHVQEPSLLPKIAGAFRQWVWLGGKKYAGYGLCHVSALDAKAPNRETYGYTAVDEIPAELHMLLLSPAAMERDGEVCGIDEAALAQKLGVGSVQILRCATATTTAANFNRTWGCASPAAAMYEAGSLFRLQCDRAPDAEKLLSLQESGIGVRREEGFGSIMFLKDFDRLTDYHKPEEAAFQMSEEAKRRVARCKWLMETPIPGGLSKSQLGTLQSLCEDVLAGLKTMNDIDSHFDRNMTERGKQYERMYTPLQKKVTQILSSPLSETLGYGSWAGTQKEKLQLLCDWFDLSRKGEKK